MSSLEVLSDCAFFAGAVVGAGSGLCAGSAFGSAVLMIFTSPVAGAVSVAGAIGGFVITGLAATVLVVVRRVRFFFVCASASMRQQLTASTAATKNLM